MRPWQIQARLKRSLTACGTLTAVSAVLLLLHTASPDQGGALYALPGAFERNRANSRCRSQQGQHAQNAAQGESSLQDMPAHGGRRSLLLAAGLLTASDANMARAISPEEREVANLFLKSSPSVLGVGEMPKARKADSPSGTGFVWDDKHVVTNFHVISDLMRPHVTFIKKDAFGADEHVSVGAYVVGTDPLSDIAVLQVDTSEREDIDGLMLPLERGISSGLKPGQEVFALGNPFGLERSMSKGVISAVSRTMNGAGGWPMSGMIQTDASINPGNSGGPLLNSEGSVVGINTAILSTSGTFSGVGFALPIDKVQKNVESMIAEGYVSRPSIGVEFAPDEMTESLGVPGAMVMKVVPGGPAQRAGLRATRHGQLGDVIVSIGGNKVATSSDVFKYLDGRTPGEEVLMSVKRTSADADSDGFDAVDVLLRLGRSNSKTKMVNI